MATFEGLSKRRSPRSFELAGQSFHLVMDAGHDYTVNFLTGETLVWNLPGEAMCGETYECMKIDETTYFVNVEITGSKPRTGATLVLDTEQSLVTLLLAFQGTNPKNPALITTRFVFGAIKVDGEELPRKRHGYTTDLVGKKIAWHYGDGGAAVHIYYHPNFYRLRAEGRPRTPEQIALREKFPDDEPTTYVKIKRNLYLVSMIEVTHFLRGGNGNNLVVLIDTDRVHDVGRSFGLDPFGKPENYLYGTVGVWREEDEEPFVSPYRV